MQINDERKGHIASMFAAFGQASDGARMAVYYKRLKDMPVQMVEIICDKAIMESKFLPTIAELREMGKSIVGEVDESKRVKTWQEAQAEIAKGISRTWFKGCLGEIPVTDKDYGKPCEPIWSTPEIAAAVNSYGMDNLQQVMSADMPTVWAQLRKAYEQACQRRKEKEVNTYVLEKGGDKLKELSSELGNKMLLKGAKK